MVRSFHKEAFVEKKYGSYIQQSYHAVEKANFYDAVYSPIVITISSVLIAVMMIFAAKGGTMQAFFGMSAGTAVAVIAYVGKVFEPLESIGMEIQNIQSAVAGVYRINEFLREEERKMPPEDIELPKLRNIQNSYSAHFGAPPGAGTNMPAAELDKVSFGYEREQEILHDVDLTVMPGENVTLIGRTARGKVQFSSFCWGCTALERPDKDIRNGRGSDSGQAEKKAFRICGAVLSRNSRYHSRSDYA